MADRVDTLPSTREKRPQHINYDEIVAIIEVGKNANKRTFYVHPGILSLYSGYFKTALKGPWVEGQGSIFELRDEDPDTFAHFVLWLYTDKINDDTLKATRNTMIHLWILADRRDVPLLKNEMIDALQAQIAEEWIFPADQVAHIYDQTMPGCKLRAMIVYSIAAVGDISALQHAWPEDALYDLALQTLAAPRPRLLSKQEYLALDLCPRFHVHDDGARCKRSI